MGNSFVALADDYSAVYWNPAGLAFVPIREVRIGLEALKNAAGTEFGNTSSSSSNSRLTIGHAGLLRAIPTSQGGIALAVGYSNPYRLDNVYSYGGWDTHTGEGRIGYYFDSIDAQGDTLWDIVYPGQRLRYADADVRGYGSLGMVNMAVGWQIAPSLGFGITVSPIIGRELSSYSFKTYKEGNLLFQNSLEKIKRRYWGIDGRLGLMYAPAGIARIGLRIVAPQYIRMYQKYEFSDRIYGPESPIEDEATILTSISGALGASFELPFMVISTEGDFRSPFPDAARGSPQSYWRVGFGGGVEVPIPVVPLVIRGGYSWHEPDFFPYKIDWNDPYIDDFETGEASLFDHTTDIHMITGGLAFLVKDYIALQASYAYSFWRYRVADSEWLNTIDEDHSYHRLIASFSFRY
jgi:hypothetical protein